MVESAQANRTGSGDETSITARVSAFSRAYHSRNNGVRVYDDPLAFDLLGRGDYETIAANMAGGISFFNPAFEGTPDEALRWVVDNQLSPSVLERSAFMEDCLMQAVAEGCSQYLILGAGYDTFAYRRPTWAGDLEVFEVDRASMIEDKRARLAVASIGVPAHVHLVEADLSRPGWGDALAAEPGFDPAKTSFMSLLGLVCYLSEEDFGRLLDVMADLMAPGSRVVFDYPSASQDGKGKVQESLARGAGEEMQARYDPGEMRHLLDVHGLEVVEHLYPREITKRYFSSYNEANPHYPMQAFPNVDLCCAVLRTRGHSERRSRRSGA